MDTIKFLFPRPRPRPRPSVLISARTSLPLLPMRWRGQTSRRWHKHGWGRWTTRSSSLHHMRWRHTPWRRHTRPWRRKPTRSTWRRCTWSRRRKSHMGWWCAHTCTRTWGWSIPHHRRRAIIHHGGWRSTSISTRRPMVVVMTTSTSTSIPTTRWTIVVHIHTTTMTRWGWSSTSTSTSTSRWYKRRSHPLPLLRLLINIIIRPGNLIRHFSPGMGQRRHCCWVHIVGSEHVLLCRCQSHRTRSPFVEMFIVVQFEIFTEFPSSSLLLSSSGTVVS